MNTLRVVRVEGKAIVTGKFVKSHIRIVHKKTSQYVTIPNSVLVKSHFRRGRIKKQALYVSPMKNDKRPNYDFHKALSYCKQRGIKVKDLTQTEWKQFLITV